MFFGNPSYQTIQWIRKNSGPDKSIPLCFTAETDGAEIQLQCIGTTLKTQVFQTSTDRCNWTDHSFDSSGMLVESDTPVKSTKFILPKAGDKIYFRSKEDNTAKTRNLSNLMTFKTSVQNKYISLGGNVMSMLSPEFE